MSLLVLCFSLLLCLYFCLFFVCLLTACFWRNKDAYINAVDKQSTAKKR